MTSRQARKELQQRMKADLEHGSDGPAHSKKSASKSAARPSARKPAPSATAPRNLFSLLNDHDDDHDDIDNDKSDANDNDNVPANASVDSISISALKIESKADSPNPSEGKSVAGDESAAAGSPEPDAPRNTTGPEKSSAREKSKRAGKTKSNATADNRQEGGRTVSESAQRPAGDVSAKNGDEEDGGDDEDDRFLDELIAEKKRAEMNEVTVEDVPDILAASSALRWKSTMMSLLHCDPVRLDVRTELKRIFGSRAIREAKLLNNNRGDSNSSGPSSGSRNPHAQRRTLTQNKLMMVRSRDHWPPFQTHGLKMECRGSDDGVTFFSYAYDGEYKRYSREFLLVQQSGDPQLAAELLRRLPWHVPSLMIMHNVAELYGQHDSAKDYLERCLFAFESTWASTFKPLQGTCRLPFDFPTNRLFLEILARYIQYLRRHGYATSALEVCKLLFSLDPNVDPMFALLQMDHYALRCREFAFIRAFDRLLVDAHDLHLPNWTWSSILADLLEQDDDADHSITNTTTNPHTIAVSSSSSSSSSSTTTVAPFSVRLAEALARFPHPLFHLIRKMAERGGGSASSSIVIDLDRTTDRSPSSWRTILAHPVFADCDGPTPATLLARAVANLPLVAAVGSVAAIPSESTADNIITRLAKTFAHLNADTLKIPTLLETLRCAVGDVLATWFGGERTGEREFLAAQRTQRIALLNTKPYRVYETLRADDLIANRSLVPMDNLVMGAMGRNVPHVNNREAREQHPLMTFMQTMLPWNNVLPADVAGGNGNGRNGRGRHNDDDDDDLDYYFEEH